jgi:flavin reductase (DIM6/NTAB) family NADH-FMN oxidoreductase RutF
MGIPPERGGGPASFRRTMNALAAGVTIVTTCDAARRPCGLTATAVCLVSQAPPLLLACVAREADCHAAFCTADAFAVHVLREDQAALSRRFAQKDHDKFAGLAHATGTLGVPLLPGTLAVVECRVVERRPAGDHTILIGQAEAWELSPDEAAGPLVHYRRSYRKLAKPET